MQLIEVSSPCVNPRNDCSPLGQIVIKTFPTGPVLRTVVDKFATVGYLHFMHRSNTIYGTRRDQVSRTDSVTSTYMIGYWVIGVDFAHNEGALLFR